MKGAPHEHPDSLPIDFGRQGDLARVHRIAVDRWRSGWRVRPCPTPRCPRWVWHRPPSDDGDPTGGR